MHKSNVKLLPHFFNYFFPLIIKKLNILITCSQHVEKFFVLKVGKSGEFITFTLSKKLILERFLGNIDAKADAKGRVFVPAAFRKILQTAGEERLVMRRDVFQECLVLYPESIWNEELTQMRARLNKWDPVQQQTFRNFVLETEVLEMDSNGRILISKRYMQAAGIHNEIRFVGMDYTIEIWAKQKLEKPLMSQEEFARNMQKFMGEENK